MCNGGVGGPPDDFEETWRVLTLPHVDGATLPLDATIVLGALMAAGGIFLFRWLWLIAAVLIPRPRAEP